MTLKEWISLKKNTFRVALARIPRAEPQTSEPKRLRASVALSCLFILHQQHLSTIFLVAEHAESALGCPHCLLNKDQHLSALLKPCFIIYD